MKRRLVVFVLALCLLLTLVPTSALAGNGITEFPQRVTAWMKIKFDCGCKTEGTGAMVSADGLITAGHNLFCKKHNKPAKTIEFYFGYVGSNDYFYRYSGSCNFFTFCDFSNGYSRKDDIGFVKFPKKFGIGWYGSQTRNASEYNGEKGFVCYYGDNGKVKMFKNDINEYDSTTITLEHSPLPTSAEGAPIYFQRGAGLNEALIGVYTGAEGGQCYFSLITRQVFNSMSEKLSWESD